MTLSFTVILTERDWYPDFGGWRCSVLNIPGASVNQIFINGRQADTVEYRPEQDLRVIRWNQNNRNRPDKIAVLISIDQSLF